MLSIFEFSNYRRYLEAWVDSKGPHAYGMKLKISSELRVSSSFISQVFNEQKTLTPDQASDLCYFIGLSEMETDYFHLLLELDRSGSDRYKERLKKKIKTLAEQSRQIGKRVPRNKELNDEQKAIYYSSWIYTGIRNLSAIAKYNDVEVISQRLGLESGIVNKVIQFLLKNGLCRQADEGVTYGPAAIHVDKESPFVNNHHQNWRFQAIQKMEHKRNEDLFFTSPMSLSKKAFEEIRTLMPTVIQNVMKISGPSNSETAACLNIDWFEY